MTSDYRLVHDLYFIYWLANLSVIYGQEGFIRRFYDNNQWIREYLPNWNPSMLPVRFRAGESKILAAIGILAALIFGPMGKILRSIQLKLLPPSIKCQMNQDTRIIVNDNMLKFHINDRREEYRGLYIKRLQDILGM
jgi:hypothetical protein